MKLPDLVAEKSTAHRAQEDGMSQWVEEQSSKDGIVCILERIAKKDLSFHCL